MAQQLRMFRVIISLLIPVVILTTSDTFPSWSIEMDEGYVGKNKEQAFENQKTLS